MRKNPKKVRRQMQSLLVNSKTPETPVEEELEEEEEVKVVPNPNEYTSYRRREMGTRL